MLNSLTGIVNLVVILSVLVIVHEFGHFLVAKLCGMRVEDFSLFFGPRLFRIAKVGETEYNVRSLPLGGFVRIAGMDPDDVSGGRPVLDAIRNPRFRDPHGIRHMIDDLDSESLAEIDPDNVRPQTRSLLQSSIGPDGLLTGYGREELEQAQAAGAAHEDERKLIQLVLLADSRAKDPGLYSQKPIWQRALTIFAGPFMSLFFGYLIFCVMGFTFGLPTGKVTNQVTVIPDGNAHKAGLLTGDRIAAIDGVPTPDGKTLTDAIHSHVNEPITLTVQRGDHMLTMRVTTAAHMNQKFDEKTGDPVKGPNGKPVLVNQGMIGVQPNPVFERHGVLSSIKLGTLMTRNYLISLLGVLKTFQGFRENVSGPIGMYQATTALQRLGVEPLVQMAGMFSLCLGIMNLLPIPVLDGGHLLLLAWEKMRRRRLTPREVYRAQVVGLAVIAAIAVFAMFNDITRIVTGHGFQ